jgi:hypothetical protein
VRPRWSIRRTQRGRWIVRQTGVRTHHSFTAWPLAMTYIRAQVSKWCVASVIRRAEESGEYEAIEACVIDAPDMHRKRRRIIQAAWWRGMSAKVEVEHEADPRDTLMLLKVRRGGRP